MAEYNIFLGGVKNNLDCRPAPSFPPPPNLRPDQPYLSICRRRQQYRLHGGIYFPRSSFEDRGI